MSDAKGVILLWVEKKNEMKLRNYLRNNYVIDGEESRQIKGNSLQRFIDDLLVADGPKKNSFFVIKDIFLKQYIIRQKQLMK